MYGPLYGPGSEGSEGSARLWQAGSKGGGIALQAMSFIARLAGTGLHWRPPPSTTSWSPSPRKRWEARLKGAVLSSMLPAHPLSGGGWRAQRDGRGRPCQAEGGQRSRSMAFPYFSAILIVFFIFLFQHIAFGFSMAGAVFFQIHALQFRGEAREDIGGFCKVQEVI